MMKAPRFDVFKFVLYFDFGLFTVYILYKSSDLIQYPLHRCFQVQLTLLTAIVKLFLKKPSETQELVQQVLSLATQVRWRCAWA